MPPRRGRKLDPFLIARSLLRPHLYVAMLDAAATTGYIPQLDRFGRVDPHQPARRVDIEDQLATLRFLTDKSLATPKAEEGQAVLGLDDALKDLRALSATELAALSAQDADASELIVIAEPDEADANPLVPDTARPADHPPGAGAACTREDEPR